MKLTEAIEYFGDNFHNRCIKNKIDISDLSKNDGLVWHDAMGMFNAILSYAEYYEKNGNIPDEWLKKEKPLAIVKLISNISYVQGNILDWSGKVDVIGHQVNCFGIMGGGLALQIKNKWPSVFNAYTNFIEGRLYAGTLTRESLLGQCQLVPTGSCFVANLFGQYDCKPGKRQTDYTALKLSLTTLKREMLHRGLNSVAFPARLGCGLAGGDWGVVQTIIKSVFAGTKINVGIVEYFPGQ